MALYCCWYNLHPFSFLLSLHYFLHCLKDQTVCVQLLLLRWCIVSLYACFGWDMSLMLVVVCLTCLFTLWDMSILAHDYLLVILLWSLYKDSLLFYKSCHNCVHNYLNTCLYDLWSTLILNLMHIISFFSRFMFDDFIDKRGEIVHKVGWTLY
jgi:hypothetical protein